MASRSRKWTRIASCACLDSLSHASADKLTTLLGAANFKVNPFWTSLFSDALKNRDVTDIAFTGIASGGGGGAGGDAPAAAAGGEAAAAAEAPKAAAKEESSEEEMELDLFG